MPFRHMPNPHYISNKTDSSDLETLGNHINRREYDEAHKINNIVDLTQVLCKGRKSPQTISDAIIQLLKI